MTVKQLIERLQKEDPKRLVVISKDGEGNGFSPLADVSTGAYRAESTWAGEIGLEPVDLTPAMKRNGYGEEDVIEDGKPALVLWPTN